MTTYTQIGGLQIGALRRAALSASGNGEYDMRVDRPKHSDELNRKWQTRGRDNDCWLD